MLLSISSTPIVSRILCIDQHEIPTSTVRIPVSAAMAGPIVEPHGQSLRTTNSCGGSIEAVRDSSRTTNPVVADVA